MKCDKKDTVACSIDRLDEEIRSCRTEQVIMRSKQCKWFEVCPMKYFYEEKLLDPKWIQLYCKGDWSKCVRYKMEEEGRYHPDWMLPDGSLDDSLK